VNLRDTYPERERSHEIQAAQMAAQQLVNATRALGLALNTNLKLRLDGMPRSNQAQAARRGAVVYWNDQWTAAPRWMSIGCYTKTELKIAALTAIIKAMRAIEQHGGAVALERAFNSFAALSAPIVAGIRRHWRDAMEFANGKPTHEAITSHFRPLAATAHPVKYGSTAAMAELKQARQDALEDVR